MTKKELLTIGKYDNLNEANSIATFLIENSIKAYVEDATPSVDLTFAGNKLNNEIRVRVYSSDYEKANDLLDKQALKDLDSIPKDYFLFDFSIDELKEIVIKRDEWSKLDYQLALVLLKKQGIDFSESEIEKFKEERIIASRKTNKAHPFWLFFGFFFAILGGLIGLWMGHYYWQSIEKDLSGQKFFTYDDRSRKLGKTMFFTSIVSITLSIIYLLLAD